ncbi:unnamed protein product, partial [Symbiodinium sp. KB8]
APDCGRIRKDLERTGFVCREAGGGKFCLLPEKVDQLLLEAASTKPGVDITTTGDGPSQALDDYERKHAERRLLRQRNARKKWTQTMQRFAKGDRNAQQEISKQAQKAHDEEQALRRAIAGKDAKDSDSEHVDLSDDEEGDGKETMAKSTIKKAKRLTVEEIRDLDADGELPSTGLLGMKFMQQAIKSKREAAKQEALGVLKECYKGGRVVVFVKGGH